MNILIISGIYPTSDNLSGGIFITRRCRELKNYNNINYKLLTVASEDNIFIRGLKKLFRKKIQLINYKLDINGVTWNNILYKRTIFKLIGEKIKSDKSILNKLDCIEATIDLKEYNLIHAHWAFPEGYIAKRIKEKYKIPYILTVHGSDIHTIPHNNETIKAYTLEVLESANKVIFVSNKLLETAKNLGYSGRNSLIIPNGIDTKEFRILNKNEIKQRLGFNNNKVVGFVGNLVAVKRADMLPEIFGYINEIYENVEFLVVGEGELKEIIIKKCKERNLKVKFAGRVDPQEVPYYMNALDVMILPSRNEAFGCVILEANSCGVVVVGSSNGGIPEAIDNNELIVMEGNDFERRCAERVVECLNNVYDENKLRNKILKYSWSEVIKAEIDLYESILN